jgi:hypothetical protein
MGTERFFPWDGKLTTHLHLIARGKKLWSYTSTFQHVFMAWFLIE